jgi:hypothetical protein
MPAGSAFTVTDVADLQPVGIVYVIPAMPLAVVVTTPVLFTVATAALPVLHDPPDEAVLNVIAEPGQTAALPVMAAGRALIVTTVEPMQPVDMV